MPKKVVIVDDSKYLINKIASFFEKEMNFEVAALGYDGNDAVVLYREHKPEVCRCGVY